MVLLAVWSQTLKVHETFGGFRGMVALVYHSAAGPHASFRVVQWIDFLAGVQARGHCLTLALPLPQHFQRQ